MTHALFRNIFDLEFCVGVCVCSAAAERFSIAVKWSFFNRECCLAALMVREFLDLFCRRFWLKTYLFRVWLK